MKIRTTITLTACLMAASAHAQQGTITFTNKTATFTNLEGRVFKNVELVRAAPFTIAAPEAPGSPTLNLKASRELAWRSCYATRQPVRRVRRHRQTKRSPPN